MKEFIFIKGTECVLLEMATELTLEELLPPNGQVYSPCNRHESTEGGVEA
jgi:hypothetical protein